MELKQYATPTMPHFNPYIPTEQEKKDRVFNERYGVLLRRTDGKYWVPDTLLTNFLIWPVFVGGGTVLTMAVLKYGLLLIGIQ